MSTLMEHEERFINKVIYYANAGYSVKEAMRKATEEVAWEDENARK